MTKMTRIKPALIFIALGLFFCVPLFAQSQHHGFHANGDCDYDCGAAGCSSIKQYEESMLPGSCANHDGSGAGKAGLCNSDWPGPLITNVSCNGTDGCTAVGKLRCNGGTAGIVFPSYDFNCPTKNGAIPRMLATVDFIHCEWPDNTGMALECGPSGGTLIAVW